MKDLKKAYTTIMDDHFPDEMTITFGDQKLSFRKRAWKIEDEGALVEKGLRYGENPGQESAMYELVNGNLVLGDCRFIGPGSPLVSGIDEGMMIQPGKHPGKINLTDIDNSLNVLKYLMSKPAAVIVKHNNPCGVAYGSDAADAFNKAFRADRIAAFGGCVAFNRAVDRVTAELIAAQYLEVVVAPDYAEGAVEILKQRKNLRIIRIDRIDKLEKYRDSRFVDFKSLIDGGIIVQQSPVNIVNTKNDLKPAETEYKGKTYKIDRLPTDREYEDLLFGWFVEQGVTSNSVLFVKNGVTVGIGTGEQDRVGVAEIAVFKAYTKYADLLCFDRYGISYNELELAVDRGEREEADIDEIDDETDDACGGLIGSCAVSDAFFPFRDGVDVVVNEGATAIVQPGGSLRDFESIEACNEADPKVSMVYTGQRAFKH
ncbi:MAG: IMP cyclohydrolase [Spirochaetes bacterium]|jgi:phosphoribosylaminoimidazolecarboxamide formyltransferase/IMP cyclohydrolase|nr:IMP cyclohydrolase [Spirochaetota bacterium]